MSARWPVVADLGDIPALTADWKPFSQEFPPRRDPALPEPVTDEELLAACRQVRLDLAAAVARSRRARGADIELPEVA